MNNFGGFKPHVLREAIGISKEQFRYWRKMLDPDRYRPGFSYQDIFAYRILKDLLEDHYMSVSELSKYDLSIIFSVVHETYFDDLEDLVLIINSTTKELRFVSEEELVVELKLMSSRKITLVYLKELIDDQIFSFYFFGNHFPDEDIARQHLRKRLS